MYNPIYLLFATLSSCTSILPGRIHVARHPRNPSPNDIVVTNGRLHLATPMPVLHYYEDGVFKGCSSKQFLSVSKHGHLVLGREWQHGFSVSSVEGAGGRRDISFNGDYTFEFCPDGLIRYNSTCKGARKIALVYLEYMGNDCPDWEMSA